MTITQVESPPDSRTVEPVKPELEKLHLEVEVSKEHAALLRQAAERTHMPVEHLLVLAGLHHAEHILSGGIPFLSDQSLVASYAEDDDEEDEDEDIDPKLVELASRPRMYERRGD